MTLIIMMLVCIWVVYRKERAITQEDMRDWAGRCADNADNYSIARSKLFQAQCLLVGWKDGCADLEKENAGLRTQIEQYDFQATCLLTDNESLKRQLANRNGQITKLKNKLENMK